MKRYLSEMKNGYAFLMMLLCCSIIAFAGLNLNELESGDETRVAGISAEMFLENDYLIPRLNNQPFVEYPPLYYWSQVLSYAVFGVNDFAAKLTSALWAVGSAVLIFLMARRMNFPPWIAGASGLMLMSSVQFLSNSRKCIVDIALAFFILFAVNAFHAMFTSKDKTPKALFFILFAAGICGGVLTKGMIGVIFPVAVIGCWILARDVLFINKFSFPLYFILGFGMLAGLAGTSIWYYLIYLKGGGEMFDTTLFLNNFGRFFGEQKDHADSFLFYLKNLPTLFWPWLPLVFVGFYQAFKEIKAKSANRDNLVLLLSFILIPFILLSIASGKRIVYLMPLYAPAALLCGYSLFNFPELLKPYLAKSLKFIKPILAGTFLIYFITFAVLSSLAAMIYPILGGLALLALFFVHNDKQKVLFLCISFSLGVASLHTMPSYYINKTHSMRPLYEECRKIEESGGKIFLASKAERTMGAAYFYMKRNIPIKDGSHMNPPEGEYWVYYIRSEVPGGKKFNDRHYLLNSHKPAN